MQRLLSLALAALTLAGPALAQDGARRTPPDVSARIASLGTRLNVTADQQARLDAVAARYRGQTDEAATWAAAAEVQAILTDAQTSALRARPARAVRPERGAESRSDVRRRAGRRASARPDRAEAAPRDPQSSERRAAGRALRNEFAPRAQALRDDLRAGRITDAEFATRSQALRAEIEARSDAARTPEQRQQVAERRARREAGEAARVRALGLTAQQRGALQALNAERVRTAQPERGTARPDAARRPRTEAGRATRDTVRARAAEILTPQQEAIMAVHRALTGGGRGHRGAREGEGRLGGRLGQTTDR